MSEISEGMAKLKELASIPMKTEQETKRVEIIMLKFKDEEIEKKAISRIIDNTKHPFKLTIYDNRPNTANTSRIWNKLIKESTCDYVMLIDSDAFVPDTDPCWLTRMMESIDDTGLVIPVSSTPGGANQQVAGATKYPDPVVNNGIWSGYCFLFKKSLYEELGDFDEEFYIYGQDSEWAHRSKKTGGAIMRKDVFVEHVGSASFKACHERGELDRDMDKVRARALFIKKVS